MRLLSIPGFLMRLMRDMGGRCSSDDEVVVERGMSTRGCDGETSCGC